MIIRNIIFWCALLIATLLCWLTALPFYLIPGKTGRRILIFFQRVWASIFLFLCKYICSLNYKINFKVEVNEPVIFACQHESAWETMAFLAILPRSSIVLKQELRWIPIYGWHAMRSGMIPIYRGGGARTLKKMLSKAKKMQRENHILIFPEGTRAHPGQKLPLHSGLYALYKNLNCPVVPVSHDAGTYWPKKSLLLRAGTVVVTVHPTIQPGLSKQVLNQTVLDYFH